MGSLNGDVMVMRNGRSTSQVSVYNYPEHLNPFYDDDQHKRLRFWKISKNENEGRRNSFSFGNLKDMWSFKSFRSKKKSSTLGISKTSESPPSLRREIVIDNGWNTFDNRLRHSAASSINGDNFQRNAPYRNSLQTLPTNADRIGFNRNDDYRSTIQVPRANPRYHRPQQKSQMPQGLRSSISSTGSTNPFDSDDGEQNADTHGGSTSVLSKSAQRKKRQAPAPPTPIHGHIPAINIESSQNITQNDELCIREDTDISNLTAEIQSFVKDKSNEDTEVAVKVESLPRVPPQEPTSNNLQDDFATTAATTVDITTTTIRKSKCSPTFNANTEVANPVKITSTITKSKCSPTINANTEVVKPVEITSTITKSKCNTTIDANTEVVKPVEITTIKVATIPPHKAEEKVEDTRNVNSPVPAKRDTNKTAKAATTHTSVSPSLKVQQKKVRIEEHNAAASTHNQEPQTNGLAKTEVININRPTSTIVSKQESTKSQIIVTSVPEEYTQPEVIKVIKSNGAIPKKSSNATFQARPTPVNDPLLYIKESNDQAQRPIPVRRASKPEIEHGQIECIHIHVSSPKATPRQDHGNSLSSFKQDHHNDTAEIITTKTPFILTSPPTSRKSVQETEQTKEIPKPSVVLSSQELSTRKDKETAKPEIKPKPPLSPKPILEKNGEVNNFAEIHKPMRSKVSQNANGHVKRESREDLAPSPPTVPMQQINEKLNEEEKQLKVKEKVVAFEIKSNGRDQVKIEVDTEGLMIVETPPSQFEKRVSEASTSTSMPSPVTAIATSNAGSLSTGSCENVDLESLYRPKPQSHMEWKRSTLAPLETNIPPEKRKSVKDIIESINRSQRLLHASANKDFTIITGGPAETSNATMTDVDHQRILDESQREIKRLVKQIDDTGSTITEPPSYSECMGVQKMDNGEIFQKCKVNKEVYDYRETSPITSNLDWNPVPKPKRTKAPYE